MASVFVGRALACLPSLAAPLLCAAPLSGQQRAPEPPAASYWVYVGAESADLIHRVRFGPGGTEVEKTISIGEVPTEIEGPHGLAISRDGKYLHVTTGHGVPDGKYWRYELGPDTLVGPGIFLGFFPATIDVTPDGLYSFSVNFNLHGDMIPSSVSVVYTPQHVEVARVDTCVMPHGSRIDPSGNFHYSACMMDDQLVEIDTRTFQVSRRFSVATGKEGPIEPGATPVRDGRGVEAASCSPTWAQPSADGRMIFVACNKSDEVPEIDRERWQVARRMRTGRAPYNIAVTPDGALLLVTLKQGNRLEVFDRASGKSLAQLENSTTLAHGVVASLDSRYAFVSSEGVGAEPGKVEVYDLEALVRVGSVDVGPQASGIAFWKMEPFQPRGEPLLRGARHGSAHLHAGGALRGAARRVGPPAPAGAESERPRRSASEAGDTDRLSAPHGCRRVTCHGPAGPSRENTRRSWRRFARPCQNSIVRGTSR